MKRIALFDFDGTITTHDTLLEFIKFAKGRLSFYLGFFIQAPFLVGYKLGFISNQYAKERVLKYFFAGITEEAFNDLCNKFSSIKLDHYIREGAVAEVQRLQKEGCEVIVVSASPQNWIADWARKTGVSLLASRLEIKNGRITGKILGKNCHGDEKVRRIEEFLNLNECQVIAAYGDTSGDLPMLKLAKEQHYKPFRITSPS